MMTEGHQIIFDVVNQHLRSLQVNVVELDGSQNQKQLGGNYLVGLVERERKKWDQQPNLKDLHKVIYFFLDIIHCLGFGLPNFYKTS